MTLCTCSTFIDDDTLELCNIPLQKKRDEIRRKQNLQANTSKFDVNISKNASKNKPLESGINPVKVSIDYKPNATLGLDPVLGDIIFEPKEIPIIRGGWYDRNGIYFANTMDSTSLKSINIIKKGVVDSKLRNFT